METQHCVTSRLGSVLGCDRSSASISIYVDSTGQADLFLQSAILARALGQSLRRPEFQEFPLASPPAHSPDFLPTYGDIRGAMSLQEAVEVMPDLGNPVDDFYQLHIPHPPTDLCFHELPPQESAKETLHGLRVVGTKHPPDASQKCFSMMMTVIKTMANLRIQSSLELEGVYAN